MTGVERQAEHRKRLKSGNGKRLSVTLSAEAISALECAQYALEADGQPHTKKAVIESALLCFRL